MKKPNIHEDKHLTTKEIKLTFDKPAFNFKSKRLEYTSTLHYTVHLYQTNNETKYYLFKPHEDSTLLIHDCRKDVYSELGKQIELNDNIDIWLPFEDEYYAIPKEERHMENIIKSSIIGL